MVSVNEPNRFEYTAWTFDHRDELASVLTEAGASDYFIRFCMQARRNSRHSVLMTLCRHHDNESPNVEACEEAYYLGGGFFSKLWEGELADAYCKADGDNRPMMEDTFSKDEIVSVGLQNGWSDKEYLAGLIEERWG